MAEPVKSPPVALESNPGAANAVASRPGDSLMNTAVLPEAGVVDATAIPTVRPLLAPPATGRIETQARPMIGERYVARILRGGAFLSGALFLGSIVLELLPLGAEVHPPIQMLRQAGLSLLLITPVARLVASGALLGIRGEPRYTLYAAGVLALLALAVTAGFAA